MPTVDASRSLLSAGAGYAAGDWANVGAEASLDLLATANLNRGIDLGLGVEALARLDGAIRQYLAADVNGQAHAAARVRAQVQIPLDLFDEVGIAVRLQAIAEAAAGVQLAIGLSIGDFLALAETDPHLRGVPFELLKIFLDEFAIQGGVMAKVAAAAMAYANVVATGSFIKRGSRQPGFTIAAEAGIGLKAGAGFRALVRFGVDDPRRLVRRTIDVAVDETIAAIAGALPAEARTLAMEATAPLKIGLRCAFELGAALAENNGAFAAGDQGKLALRLAQVGLEEMQRFILERAIEFASLQLRVALRDLPFGDTEWAATQGQRQALADRLRALPNEPFEATDANRTYWRNVVADTANLVTGLAGGTGAPAAISEPLAVIWTSAQLLMKSVERISVAQARASAIGAPTVGTTAAFDGTLPVPPDLVRARINATLSRGAAASVRQADAVAYLLRVIGNQVEAISPAAAAVMAMLTGQTGAPAAEALSVVLSNIGAFAPDADGRVRAEASLGVLRDGLRTYVNTRLDTELRPLIESVAAPEVRTYLDEVLLSTLRTVVDTVFAAVLTWQSGSGSTQRALRELCSSLVMRLFGRSLVVIGDVVLARTLDLIRDELRTLAANANRPGGAVPTLSGLTGLDRALLADLVTETLEVCADTFGAMPPDRRARMRDLMYLMIDTTPPGADASTLEALKAAGMVGNAEAAFELTQLLGEEIAGNLVRFVQALLTRVAGALLALLADAIADAQRAVEAWMRDIEALAQELLGQLASLLREIGQLQQALDDAVDQLLAQASTLLGGFSEHSGSRGTLRTEIKSAVGDAALDALAAFPGYGAIPGDIRRGIRRTVRNLVDGALDDEIFEEVLDVLAGLSTETAELLDDLRAIEPGDNLAVAIADIALDRIEDGIRAAFNGNPSMRIRFEAPIIGDVDLGRVEVPMGAFVSVVRSTVRTLGRFNDAVAGAAQALGSLLDTEAALQAAEHEHAAASAIKDEADQRIAETRDGSLDLVIAEPQPAGAISGPLTLRLEIAGGSASMLAGDGLSHRRLFVWVNQEELTLAGARVGVKLPPSATMSGPARQSGGDLSLAHPLARTRAARHDEQRRTHLIVRKPTRGRDVSPTPGLRVVSAGALNRFAGVPQRSAPANGVFPPRVPGRGVGASTERPTLAVSIDVPASMLHEGINAIACALVPGPAARRVERAVSFLYLPSVPAAPGVNTMPPGRVTGRIPDGLLAILRARGVSQPATKGVPRRVVQVRGNTWVVPLRERERRLSASRRSLTRELQAAAKRRGEVRAAISNGDLRPRRPEAPARKPKGGEAR